MGSREHEDQGRHQVWSGATIPARLLAADEAGEGQDLNFDGDRQDQVFVLFDIAARRVINLALAGGPDEARFGTLSPRGCFAFLASERAQGRDLDGDRDQADDVLHGGR